MPDQPACEDCEFFTHNDDNPHGPGFRTESMLDGICRRRSPTREGFPYVAIDQPCGEHKPKPHPIADASPSLADPCPEREDGEHANVLITESKYQCTACGGEAKRRDERFLIYPKGGEGDPTQPPKLSDPCADSDDGKHNTGLLGPTGPAQCYKCGAR